MQGCDFRRDWPIRKRVLLSAVCVAFATVTWAQGTVKGFVRAQDDGAPVLFAAVVLEGTTYGVSTDIQGYYSLSKIPAGTYTLVVSSVEYKPFRTEVEVRDDRVLTQNIALDAGLIELESAVVSTERGEQLNTVRMSVESIQPADIKRIPSLGGTPDLVQVLQTLPGFVSTGDQGGQLYIRGGSPVQNKVLLDGMIIYNAFHSIGLFSVFDTDIISNADIYTGGFSGRYGGRISSIMDVSTRDGSLAGLSGRIGASPFGSKLLIEGPLGKRNARGGGTSFLLSGKRSYLEQSSKLLYSYIDEEGLPFNFTDLYGKVTFAGGAGSRLSLFGFSFSDDVSYQALSNLDWTNVGAGGQFLVVPTGSAVLIKGNFASSRYRIDLQEDGLPDRYSQVNGFNFGLNFKYVLGDDEARYGIQAVGLRTDFRTFNALGVTVEQTENTTELAGYFDYKLQRGPWIVNPSLRIQYYSSLAKFSPEPRLGVKFKASDRLRLKAAGGLYSQNLISANSDRDVVNLFYGFLAGPSNLQDELIGPDGQIQEVTHSLQTAAHAVGGFEYDLTERINVNIEAYTKWFTQLTNSNRNKLFPDTYEFASVPESQRKDFIVETGRAEGVDVVVKYEDKLNYLWLVYSLGNVDRWDGFRWYDPVFDRRHNVNLLASRKFGAKAKTEVSARWNLGSGLPFTQTQGYYQPVGISSGIDDNYVNGNPIELGIVYADLNAGRLPVYHRLDLSVRRSWKLGERIELDANASITNVYSRANIFYINRVTGERVDQLPFLPSVGVDMKF
ncbi:MAG TPA: TonB-dependent receptor [Flavobacteriales bacterium]|nr:TonB-dependent receptor [Flavobacteriales bacterium]